MGAQRLTARLRAANGWAVDIGLALLVQVAMSIPFVVERPDGLRPATWADYALTSLAVLPLVWRRRAPVAVTLAVLAAGAAYKLTLDGPGQPLPYPGLVALYSVAALSPVRRRVSVAALVAVLIAPSVALNTEDAKELLFSFFVFGAAYALGRLTHTRGPTPRPSRTARRSWSGPTGSRPSRPRRANGPGSRGRCTTSSRTPSAS